MSLEFPKNFHVSTAKLSRLIKFYLGSTILTGEYDNVLVRLSHAVYRCRCDETPLFFQTWFSPMIDAHVHISIVER